jgi:hypothetical protein
MKYPIGIQSFEKIRKGGFVYVDKTDLIYKLAKGSVFFLARPRRFGKSLLMSTLKAYFEGRRDLFEGLKMEALETEWTEYPVICFDFSKANVQRADGLRDYIIEEIYKQEQANGITPSMDFKDGQPIPTPDVARRFANLVEGLHKNTGRQAVTLIDEYDKPLLDLLGTDNPAYEEQLVRNRELLKNFFAVFKAADQHLRFIMLTGVTKFSQVTMFSGANQPDDITLDEDYEALCGITQQELETVFRESIDELAAKMQTSRDEALNVLKANYDGYHFSTRMTDVYNPFSVINALKKRAIDDYWFASGSPSYLVRLLGNTPEDVMAYTSGEYSRDEFVNYKADMANPLPMIFQAGYFTIKSYDREFRIYRLDYPNKEVKQGLMTLLANSFLKKDNVTQPAVIKIVRAMRAGDTDLIRRLFTSFLAETPYAMRPKKDQKDRELYFHYTFYLLMRLISCYTVYTEKQLSEGRADCIVETPHHVYIFEFKLDGTAQEALQQINDRGYAKAYEADTRAVYKIGASFSSKTGTVEEWETVKIEN